MPRDTTRPDADDMTLEQRFAAWVREQEPEDTFDPWNGRACVGYQFLSASGYPVRFCGIFCWRDTGGVHHALPPIIGEGINWAAEQVSDGSRVPFSSLALRLSGKGL